MNSINHLSAEQVHRLASLPQSLRQSFLTLRAMGISPRRAYLFVTAS